MSELQTSSVGSIAAAISNATVQLLNEYTGRGPTKARTAMDRDVITVVLQETMTKAERTLVMKGEGNFVIDMRHRFQHAMQEDLVAAVERLTQRKVMAFMSDNHIDPTWRPRSSSSSPSPTRTRPTRTTSRSGPVAPVVWQTRPHAGPQGAPVGGRSHT